MILRGFAQVTANFGELAGFASILEKFPSLELTAVMLCNNYPFSAKFKERLNRLRSKKSTNLRVNDYRAVYKLIALWKHNDGGIWDENRRRRQKSGEAQLVPSQ